MEKNKKQQKKSRNNNDIPPEYDGSHEEKWERRRNRDWRKLIQEDLEDE